MTDRLKKEDFVRLLATQMDADEAMATAWVDGIVEMLYASFKDGKGVTFPGFGSFYVRPEPARATMGIRLLGSQRRVEIGT